MARRSSELSRRALGAGLALTVGAVTLGVSGDTAPEAPRSAITTGTERVGPERNFATTVLKAVGQTANGREKHFAISGNYYPDKAYASPPAAPSRPWTHFAGNVGVRCVVEDNIPEATITSTMVYGNAIKTTDPKALLGERGQGCTDFMRTIDAVDAAGYLVSSITNKDTHTVGNVYALGTEMGDAARTLIADAGNATESKF